MRFFVGFDALSSRCFLPSARCVSTQSTQYTLPNFSIISFGQRLGVGQIMFSAA